MSEKKFLHKKIEVTRFELAASASRTLHSTKLSHTSRFKAGEEGLEPPFTVLETVALPLNYSPL